MSNLKPHKQSNSICKVNKSSSYHKQMENKKEKKKQENKLSGSL